MLNWVNIFNRSHLVDKSGISGEISFTEVSSLCICLTGAGTKDCGWSGGKGSGVIDWLGVPVGMPFMGNATLRLSKVFLTPPSVLEGPDAE